MRVKKIVAILLGSLLMISLFAGCGGKNGVAARHSITQRVSKCVG